MAHRLTAPSTPGHRTGARALRWLIVSSALSGLGALAQQVVWVRSLGEAFGSGPVSVAVVLSLFFAGLGLGARWGGPAADLRRGAIGLVLALEGAAAALALLFLPLESLAAALWLAVVGPDLGPGPALLGRAVLAVPLVLPPAFVMGAQLPALVRHALRRPGALGRPMALLYGANTAGAAVGAALAGFVLLPGIGPAGALAVAAALHLAAGASAYWGRLDAALPTPLDHTTVGERDPALVAHLERARAGRAKRRRPVGPVSMQVLLMGAALASGFVSLGLEVVWTRALASRLSGTVYSYTSVLTAYLLALALGALVAARLGDRGALSRPARGLSALGAVWLGLGAGALLSGALLVHLPRLGSGDFALQGVSLFVAQLREWSLAAAVMAPALFFAGLQLPLLVALVGRGAAGAGRAAGRVLAVNAVGTAVAPAFVGLLLVPTLGLGGTLALLGWVALAFGLWLLASAFAAAGRPRRSALMRALPAVLVAGGAQLAMGDALIAARIRPGAQLVAYQDGWAAGVAVVDEPGGNRVLELDGEYRLGDLGTRFAQARQGLLARLLAPDLDGATEPALFIGLGTGTSAAALLDSGARRLTVAEILPDIAWTLPYFQGANQNLHERIAAGELELCVTDARELVRRSPERYGLVVADLFLPWRAGEGAMYTREHFEAVRRSLLPGGRFVQWLPLYQLGEGDLAIIVRTFLDVFPGGGALWLYYNAAQPAIALVGAHGPVAPPDPERVEELLGHGVAAPLLDLLEPGRGGLEVAGSWIAGGDALADWCADAPLETRARPRIEFRAARSKLAEPRARTARTLEAVLQVARSSAHQDEHPQRGPRRRALARLLGALSVAELGDGQRALELGLLALEADGGFRHAGLVLESLGFERRAAGDAAGAGRAVQALVGSAARPAGGHALAAALALDRGDRASAETSLAEALAADPGHPGANALRAAIR
ncbi:MAG: hypothetical protein GC161_02755 [Planctomycetaceae bacterium]|nr:hypothetical protein [Planctomycetaceae bacterium]